MLQRLRGKVTYANVVASLALFIALGGSGYAAIKVGAGDIKSGAVGTRAIKNNDVRGRDIRNGTIRDGDVRRGTLGGRSINESRLGVVPRAQAANTLGGITADQLRVRCPAGTALAGAGCFELAARPAVVYGDAAQLCRMASRRLPTASELLGLFSNQPAGLGSFSPNGEFTANASESGGALRALVMKNSAGGTWETVSDTAGNSRQFRCVALPSN